MIDVPTPQHTAAHRSTPQHTSPFDRPAMIQLTYDPIDTAGLTESVRDPAAGAVVLFLGTVRELTDGRRTLALDYEAYPEMATAKMQEIVETAQRKWPISSAGIVHRLGHLELGAQGRGLRSRQVPD